MAGVILGYVTGFSRYFSVGSVVRNRAFRFLGCLFRRDLGPATGVSCAGVLGNLYDQIRID